MYIARGARGLKLVCRTPLWAFGVRLARFQVSSKLRILVYLVIYDSG